MDAEEKKEHHSKLLYAYKEFVCQTLDPFFDSHQLEFVDPDEDIALPESEESDWEYNGDEGYDSNDEDNPEFLEVISSGDGDSSDATSEEAQLDFNALSNRIINKMGKPHRTNFKVPTAQNQILKKRNMRRLTMIHTDKKRL